MLDLLVRGGLVVTPTQTRRLDIGIQAGQIAFVAEPGAVAAEAARVIDAADRLVLPGGVEAHAHIAEPMHKGWTRGEEVWLPSPEAATRAAIFGGTTFGKAGRCRAGRSLPSCAGRWWSRRANSWAGHRMGSSSSASCGRRCCRLVAHDPNFGIMSIFLPLSVFVWRQWR